MYKRLIMLSINFTALVLTACMEPEVQRNPQTIGVKTIGPVDERPGGFQQNPGETYPYPEIIYQEFVPSYHLWQDTKCKTWRITWPSYDSDYNNDLIPTVLSLTTGGLNSIEYLNDADPQLTYSTHLSLFNNRKVFSSDNMLADLDHLSGTDDGDYMQTIYFQKGNVSVNKLMEWVQTRPQRFEIHWPGVGIGNYKMDYQEGDFIHFWLNETNEYGGIRIVSDTPRIIEVYLAVENSPQSAGPLPIAVPLKSSNL